MTANDTAFADPGPWHVFLIGSYWCVQHKGTGRTRRIGPAKMRGKNYFDATDAEAVRRNKLEEIRRTVKGAP